MVGFSDFYGTSSAGTPTAQYGAISDWASVIQGMSSGGGPSSGPLGGAGTLGAAQSGASVAGTALSVWATLGEMRASSAISQYSQDILGVEGQINEARRDQMNLQTNRQQLENLRNTQKALATGKAAATNQGAQFGSGIAGGRGGDLAEGATIATNLSQNQEVGNKVFDLTAQINQYRSQIAQEQSIAGTYQGYASIGSSIEHMFG